jgi:hypothetical protein
MCSAHLQPVGQGCFYTACISDEQAKNQFSLVYDCGSVTPKAFLPDKVEEFCGSLHDQKLNMLVISHFDADHVNGIPCLLNKLSGIKYVFLPYISPIRRLFYSLRFPDQSPEFYEFLAQPVKYLIEHHAEEIVYVTGNSDDDNNISNYSELDEIPPFDPEKLKVDDDVKNNNRESIKINESFSDAEMSKIKILRDKAVNLSNYWEFRFFQKDEQKIDGVLKNFEENELDELDGNSKIHVFLQELKKISNTLKPQDIIQVIKNKSQRKQIRQAYKNVDHHHNDVSLVLWHGPVYNKYFPAVAYGISASYSRKQKYYRHFPGKGGTVLTGDLKLIGSTMRKFENYYDDVLEKTAFFVLPHHGSHYNWHLRSFMRIDRDICYMASAGFRNQYCHPHLDLINELENYTGHPVLWSHEFSGISMKLNYY